MLVQILLGAVLGGLFVLVARRLDSSAETRLLALGLIVAAIIYVVLALAAADRSWLGLEAAGLGIFGLIAWLGVRASLWWLALGWAAHVGWDVGLHLERPQAVVGPWYPLLCVGFDLVVAGYLLGPASGRGRSPTEAA
jgi:Family of unknown function (DUF6010)